MAERTYRTVVAGTVLWNGAPLMLHRWLIAVLLVTTACKKAEDASADPAPKTTDPAKVDKPAAGSGSAAVAVVPDPNEPAVDPKAQAALAAEVMTKLGQFRDKVCACKDKACTDKVQDEVTEWGTNMKDFTPDDETTKKLDAMEHEMARCAAKAAGEGDPKIVGVNNDMETKGLALMDKMTDMFVADGTNCDKLAADLKTFITQNKPFMEQLETYEKTQTAEQKHNFEIRNMERTETGAAKIKPVMEACATSTALQTVLKDMPM